MVLYSSKLVAFLSVISIMSLLLAMCVLPMVDIDLNLAAPIHSVYAQSKQIKTVLDSNDVVANANPLRLSNHSNANHFQIESDLGTESSNVNNWITVNHDIYGTRSSAQTVINASNVAKLKLKWRLINDAEIQDPPIIIDGKGYVQDYTGTVIAFDTHSGKIIWKLLAGSGPTMGLTFNNGLIFVSTAFNANVLAINATSGNVVWKSPVLGDSKAGYNIPTFPIVWKDYVIVGSAGHDDSSSGVVTIKGNITALNRTNGDVIWNLHTTAGDWVSYSAPKFNAGANDWSGGSIDPETGIIYMPIGSASPNFNADSRQSPNLYSNHIIAVNITNGKIIWATPFIAHGTVLNVRVPDTHDWDTSWGSSVSRVNYDNGTQKKLVIGHDKMGNIMAMDATTGHPVWWKTIGPNYNIDSLPSRRGSGMIWFYGISNFHAVDDVSNSLYISATNRGVNYFLDGISGHKKTAPNTIQDGLRNGTVIAMDMRSGKVKWQLPTEFPPRVSPLVTDKIVFVGYIPFSEEDKTNRSGIVLALDKQTGSKIWEYDLHAPIGQVGPSIAEGMLFVPTGRVQANQDGGSTNAGGSIAAFGLP
ncbi:MAG TPA: PQQ-binding-like beta-propeller repeat protein [Nitrososphaeraceae archaeon]